MNTYTFKSKYGDYSFSDNQIESNPYLTSREKEIMHGLALGQTVAKNHNTPSNVSGRKYDYKVDMDKQGRRTLEKNPTDFVFDVDWSKRRWYESKHEFLMRLANKAAKEKTVRTKEVKREKFDIERSTFEDGSEVTNWNKKTQLFY